MILTEQHLESQVSERLPRSLAPPPWLFARLIPPPAFLFQNVTKGARHKIALSIQKLRERPSVLKSLEKVAERRVFDSTRHLVDGGAVFAAAIVLVAMETGRRDVVESRQTKLKTC